MNLTWVLKKVFLRISGREARRLFSEVNKLKENLETNQSQLQSTQQELAATSHQLTISRESRDTRIHRFDAEAL